MKKQGLKVTSKVLTGLVLLSGVTALPTKAVDVQPAAVDVNVKNVKANVFEKDGHFYAKLVADKEVANVVVRITTENKAEFLIKRDIIKAGEEVVVELDLNTQVPTRKLPHTATVKAESFTTVNKVSGHTFKITVRYEIATDEVKAQQKTNNESKNRIREEKTETPTDVPSIADLTKKTAPTVGTPAPAAPVEKTTKPAETPKTTEPSTVKPNTPEGTKPSATPTNLVANTPVATVPVTPVNTVMTNTPKTEAPKDVAKVDPKKVEIPAPPVAGTREEQIKQAFLAKVAQLRSINGLPALIPNAALNTSSQRRSADVPTRAIDGNIHGPNGTIRYETDAARAAGYNGSILANVAISGDYGTPEQVAQHLFDILFKEIGNVVPTYPYGHRNTLLDATAKDVGVGVTIKNGQVYLVQHQSSNGVFNGTSPKAGKYLDGTTTVYLNGNPVK
ncbi:CAP domain-containing protein [uncultured Gemella sp.]|uniref:CAP domain-containing protein n=1 Tax=uncultured Gemella sp. TaxID=254352 RepID=UPI0028D6AA19|nr:CAP domain-containing protein [uncultured Gemella sp.]